MEEKIQFIPLINVSFEHYDKSFNNNFWLKHK